jgi:hypothetical protein
LHELYHPKADTNKVVEDFLAFCKLAVKAKVLPSGWDWPAFLSKAPDLLPYVFEKEDAKEKWGRENVFAAGELLCMPWHCGISCLHVAVDLHSSGKCRYSDQ